MLISLNLYLPFLLPPLHSQTHTLLQFLTWNYAKNRCYVDVTKPLSTPPMPPLHSDIPPPVSTLKLCQTDAMLISLNLYLPFLLPPLHSQTHPLLQFLTWNYAKNRCYVDVTKPLSTPPMPPLHSDTHPPPVSTLKLCQTCWAAVRFRVALWPRASFLLGHF